ncbi:pYEATS domain-containing protein [Flavobacterium sp. ZS1P70]|uniref:PYEATS domain-containing protein n=1 Tax=Flavobacterium zhoui TaxID=3230414 RepID=A0ABW6I7C0_9FLAO
MRPTKQGQIAKFHTPQEGENPEQLYVVLTTQSIFKEGVNNTDETTIKSLIEKAKMKMNKGMLLNSNDPQKGQWGGKAANNDRELIATVEGIGNILFKINLKVVSTNIIEKSIKDNEVVLFALHPTFGDPPFRIVETEKGTAELNLYSYGSFTVGVFADNGKTELELDLATLPGVSKYFKAN